ncbi:hypothetical protein ABRY95_13825 [Castellaniella ginsengisoli]|uniref:Uncharacterized protein n=1 Tax=Castellaniella ginsengisoli TaxID=546114 RepID=A0AB39H3S9_9BURK
MRREVRVTLRVAWWFRWYWFGVVWMSDITGLAPDMRKVAAWLARATKVEVV